MNFRARCLRTAAVLVVLLAAASAHLSAQPWFNAATTPRIAASELRPGMKGEVWTVFEGTEPEPFTVEFVGLLENELGPGKHMILCRLTDERVQKMGAVAGMSGSPLYFDGKLAGALSYSIQVFETVRHAGFTPIADILEVSTFEARPPEGRAAPVALAQGTRTPLRPAFSVSGLDARTLAAFREPLEQAGLELQGATGGGSGGLSASPRPFRPGDAVAVALAAGDISIAGTGTVSYVDGDNLYAFGHPMLGVGTVEFPMARAEIVTIAASLYRSFKLSNTREVVGTISQDRLSAIYGRIGTEPRLIPLTVMLDEPAGERVLRSRVVRDRAYTPLIAAMAVLQTANRNAEDRFPAHRLDWRVTFEQGLPEISRSELLPTESAAMNAAFGIYSLLSEIMDHPLGRAVPASIEARITPLTEPVDAELEGLRASMPVARPGDSLRIELRWRERLGVRRQQTESVTLPNGLEPGTYRLVAVTGPELDRMVGASAAAPNLARDLPGVLQALAASRSSNGLHLALLRQRPQLLQPTALAEPPPSVRRILSDADPRRYGATTGADLILSRQLLAGRIFPFGMETTVTVEP